MASNEPAHAEWGPPMGVGDLALECVENAMEELRSTTGRRVQRGYKAQSSAACGFRIIPRNDPGAAAGMPASVLRRHEWQIPRSPFGGFSGCKDAAFCLC